MAAKQNDLLSDHPNATFAVVFDVYTPRPHFIIVPQTERSVNREFSHITDVQTQQLIETGKSILNCFEIDRGTLSIHRGSWKSKKRRTFHAHFCVEVENYLRVFEKRKEAILKWPSQSNPRSYAKDVEDYPGDRSSLKKEEVEKINTNLSCSRDIPPEKFEGGITNIVYHLSHPKIGFVRTKPETIEEFQQVLTAMEKFAKELGLSKDGCQICLYLGSVVPTDEWNFTSKDGKEVVGHIVMAGFRFYKLCPVDQRERWFSAYTASRFQYALT